MTAYMRASRTLGRHRTRRRSGDPRRCRQAASIRSEFWQGLSALINDLSPRNAELLATRATLQSAIDRYHRERAGTHDADHYRAFLEEIGYLVPPGPAFEIDTAGCRPGDHDGGRSAAGRADHQRALRPQRRQRAMGLAVRRALRNRCPRRPPDAGPVRPAARRARHRLGARLPRRGRARWRRPTARHARTAMSSAIAIVDGAMHVTVRRRRQSARWTEPSALAGYTGDRGSASIRSCSSTTVSASRSSSIAPTRSAQPTRRVSPTS